MKKNNYVVVFITTPNKEKITKKIVTNILSKKLAACVNIIKNITSNYWWDNKICNDKETLLIIKTKKNLFQILLKEIKKLHPYKVPEIIVLPIVDGNKDYIEWIDDVVRGS